MCKDNVEPGQGKPEEGRILVINQGDDPDNCPAISRFANYSGNQPGGPARIFLNGKEVKEQSS